jgi:hypothetical protein
MARIDFASTRTYNQESDFIFDSNYIQFDSDLGLKLVDNPGQDFIQNFDNDTGFIYDSTLAQFSGGTVNQIDKRPANSICGSQLSSVTDLNWGAIGFTDLTATLNGSPIISGGKLFCSGTQGLYWDDSLIGALSGNWVAKFKYTPNYTTTPAANVNIFALSQATGSTDQVVIFNSPSGNTLRITANGLAAVTFGVWTPTAGQEYVFEIICISNQVSLYIDGVQLGATQAISPWQGTTSNLVHLGAYSNLYNIADGSFRDLILYSTAAQTTAYTIPNAAYLESVVIVPEMEYTGAGTLISFDAFTTTEGGSPRYTLQIGQSGVYLYWNGSAWVASNDTYEQANDVATFNANVGSLSVSGEIYGQFKVIFGDTNVQSSVDQLTASLTAQIYPTNNPIFSLAEDLSADELLSIAFTETITGSDLIRYVVKQNSDYLYWSGTEWITSDQSYAQSNISSDVIANITELNNSEENAYNLLGFLHSSDGSTTPLLTSIIYKYFSIDFVVEDGTAKPDSTSYATTSQFVQYWLNRGTDYSSNSTTEIKQWLNKATEYIDLNYNFEGSRVDEDQALKWPRYGVIDKDGIEIEDDVIPEDIIDAACYLAAQVQNGTLQEIITNVKSESYGPVSKTYSGPAGAKTYSAVDNYLKYYIIQGVKMQRVN